MPFLCALYDWLCAVWFFDLAISDPFCCCCSCESQDERKRFRVGMRGGARKTVGEAQGFVFLTGAWGFGGGGGRVRVWSDGLTSTLLL
jgi:hypothetical protein